MSMLRALGEKLWKTGRDRRGERQRRGQATVELALTMPLLALLLAVVIDGGLAFNSWLRVTTAARDATRFAMDAGSNTDIRDLVYSKVPGLDTGQLTIYIIKGKTNCSARITDSSGSPLGSEYWSVTKYGPGGANSYKVLPTDIEKRLVIAINGTQADAKNVPFTIVEVDYNYSTFLGKIIGADKIPMTSFAIVQQYTQQASTCP